MGDEIDDDESAMLKLVSKDVAIRSINKQIMDNRPQEPAELSSGESDAVVSRRARYRPYWRYGLQNYTGKLSENLAGNALSNLAGLLGEPALNLPPRTYLAITEKGPEVETGISYAKEEASFHVVEGRW